MPVEFIGMIATQQESEIHPRSGPVVDRAFVRAFVRAHEDAGFDKVLIGYSAARPDGLQVAAYAAAHTERLHFLVAHRPGFVFPTLAARSFATLDQFTEGRVALHTITGGNDAEQRRDGDYLSKDERYARTDEYLEILKQAWTSTEPFSFEGQYYRFENYSSEVRPFQQPRIPIYFGGSSEAAYAVGGKHADVYALVGRAAGRNGRPDRRYPRRSRKIRPLPQIQRLVPSDPRTDRRPGLGTSAPHSCHHAGQRSGYSWSVRPEQDVVTVPTAHLRMPGRSDCWRRPRRCRTPRSSSVDAARSGYRSRRQFDSAGRHAGDGGPGNARLHRYRREHASSSVATTRTTTRSTTVATSCPLSAPKSSDAIANPC